MPNARGVDMASEHPDPSCLDTGEETDVDVEIVEEGDEGKTTGPVRGQSDLEPVTYRIGRSGVTEAILDKYLEQGLLKASLRRLCRAPGREEVP